MKRFAFVLAMAMWTVTAWAADTQYVIRVDGLACPFCAYGVEKKLNKIDGVERVDIDLNDGLVTVDVLDSVKLSEPQMRQLLNDSGFTYRSMTERAL